jgi:hypothetical protein
VTIRSTTSSSGSLFPFGSGENSNQQSLVLKLEGDAWKLSQAPFLQL